MSDGTGIDPRHSATRLVLRTLGPATAGLGLLLVAVGFGSFFSSFGTFGPPGTSGAPLSACRSCSSA
jgi:hypothetical protein